MPCFYPLEAFKRRSLDGPGKAIVFAFSISGPREAYDPIKLPCGQCVGCRLERSRQWAIRCIHEASSYSHNCFITLTFSSDFLSSRSNEWSLNVRDFQLFMKRLRKRFGSGIRFYHCGEYGSMCSRCDLSLFNCTCGPNFNKVLGRPHYHACLFNFDFPDKELWKVTDGGCRLYISQSLSELWPFGFSTIGDVTFESAAYVARYIMKKITGDMADGVYFRHDTGELLKPEYTTMSRRPGIARDFFDKFADDIYPHDFVVVNNRKMRPPRYYDTLLKAERPFTFDDVKFSRLENAKLHVDNCTPERLAVREAVQLESLRLLPRNKEF